jgi:hypothetical protein
MNNKLKFHVDSDRAYTINKHLDEKSKTEKNLMKDT